MNSFKLIETKAERMKAVGQNDKIARYMSVCSSKRFRKDVGLVDIRDNVLLHYNFDTDEKRVIKGKGAHIDYMIQCMISSLFIPGYTSMYR